MENKPYGNSGNPENRVSDSVSDSSRAERVKRSLERLCKDDF